jgi:hypothetical protein
MILQTKLHLLSPHLFLAPQWCERPLQPQTYPSSAEPPPLKQSIPRENKRGAEQSMPRAKEGGANQSIPRGEEGRAAADPPEDRQGKRGRQLRNLEKFVLRPVSGRGIDDSSVPAICSTASIEDELQNSSPEAVSLSEGANRSSCSSAYSSTW